MDGEGAVHSTTFLDRIRDNDTIISANDAIIAAIGIVAVLVANVAYVGACCTCHQQTWNTPNHACKVKPSAVHVATCNLPPRNWVAYFKTNTTDSRHNCTTGDRQELLMGQHSECRVFDFSRRPGSVLGGLLLPHICCLHGIERLCAGLRSGCHHCRDNGTSTFGLARSQRLLEETSR